MTWPDECMRVHGGRSHWRDWLPEKGMEGQVRCNRKTQFKKNFGHYTYIFLLTGGSPLDTVPS